MKLTTRILTLNAKQSLVFKAANSIIFFIVLLNLLYKIIGVKFEFTLEIFSFADTNGILKVILGYFIAIILAPLLETLLIQRFFYFVIKDRLKIPSVAFIVISALLFGLFNLKLGWQFLPFSIIPELIYGYIYVTLKESDQSDKAFTAVVYMHSVVYFCLFSFHLFL